MSTTKDDFLALLMGVNRDGMEDLIEWLASTDFFEAPSSTKFHGNYKGGLCDHSLNTYDALCVINENFLEKDIPMDSLLIVGLLHDVCKINFYVVDEEPATNAQMDLVNKLMAETDFEPLPKEKRTKGYISKVIEYLKSGANGSFPQFTTYKVKDSFPMGHGEKSVYLLNQFIALTDEEALAIRWHLGSFDPGTSFNFPSGAAMKQAVEENKLVSMLISADFMATWLVDLKV